MAKADLKAILEQESTGKVDRPKPLPMGTYLAVIRGPHEFDTAATGTDFVLFNAEILEAYDDVDADDLKSWAQRADGSTRKLRGTPVPRLIFYMTPDAKWRLDKFFEDLGILEKGKTTDEILSECPGREFVVNIIHKPSQDGEVQYANVKSTAPAP